MMPERSRTILIRIFCALALVMSGLAGPASASNSGSLNASQDLSAYRLPDGTLPIICFGNGRPDDGSNQGGHCDECLSYTPSALPQSAQAIIVLPLQSLPVPAGNANTFNRSIYSADRPNRGPPAFLN